MFRRNLAFVYASQRRNNFNSLYPIQPNPVLGWVAHEHPLGKRIEFVLRKPLVSEAMNIYGTN